MSNIGIPALPQRKIGILERPDCRLHYEVTGSGPPIVFLHGLGGNHLSWWQQVAHFAPSHTCVTLSARGFLPSSPIVGGPDPADFVADLAALISHLGLQRPTLVAQSMGGWGAVEYVLSHKGVARAVVLAATTGTLDPRQIGEPENSRLAAWQQASERAAVELTAAGIHVAAGARMAKEQSALHLLYRCIDDINVRLDKIALRHRLGVARVRSPSDISQAGCPVLFISGDEDIVIPPFAAEAIVRVSPGAKVAHIPDAGHSTYFERAACFNEHVTQFLST